eukprot:457334-Hanusia_phi.AAC.1
MGSNGPMGRRGPIGQPGLQGAPGISGAQVTPVLPPRPVSLSSLPLLVLSPIFSSLPRPVSLSSLPFLVLSPYLVLPSSSCLLIFSSPPRP